MIETITCKLLVDENAVLYRADGKDLGIVSLEDIAYILHKKNTAKIKAKDAREALALLAEGQRDFEFAKHIRKAKLLAF